MVTVLFTGILNSLYPSFWYRGLASADEQTRERVAREGGEARAEDKESLREGGRKGGKK